MIRTTNSTAKNTIGEVKDLENGNQTCLPEQVSELVLELSKAGLEVEKKRKQAKLRYRTVWFVVLSSFAYFVGLMVSTIQKLPAEVNVLSFSALSYFWKVYVTLSTIMIIAAYWHKVLYSTLTEYIKKFIREPYLNFEKLLRKTSEMEEFNPQLTQQQRQELRSILREATKIYNKLQYYIGLKSQH